MFKKSIKSWITLVHQWLTDPEDYNQLEKWCYCAEQLAESYEFTEKQQLYVDQIMDCYYEQYHAKIKQSLVSMEEDAPSTEQLDELLQRKQTEQRTAEWYRQMTEIISASELGNLFASARQRAKMVVSKTLPYQPRNNLLAVSSSRMTAFDWGIRFEPVVKQIYEYRYGVEIRELGRLHHPTDPRCTASPDGLIYRCPENRRKGQLIEIKCPVTRVIDGSIPKDYYAQMQMQLHVTGLKKCNYVEASFSSPYNDMALLMGPGLYSGFIALVQYAEPKNGQYHRYEYSPMHATKDWRPVIEEDEEIVEMIPWCLHQWHEQIVVRNEEWWTSLVPILDQFWKDVEAAKHGEFVVPESTRASKKSKIDSCMIQFRKLDEQGNELPQEEES
jgi:hypothetical protein